jgi:hypothetical protein
MILNRIYKTYFLPLELYARLKRSIRYNYSQDMEDVNEFVDGLPYGLKEEVSMFIHEKTYKNVYFFRY